MDTKLNPADDPSRDVRLRLPESVPEYLSDEVVTPLVSGARFSNSCFETRRIILRTYPVSEVCRAGSVCGLRRVNKGSSEAWAEYVQSHGGVSEQAYICLLLGLLFGEASVACYFVSSYRRSPLPERDLTL